MENYFPDGVPSTVLAIVQANASEEASLYTSSNNSPVNPGQTEEQGAAAPEGYTYITINGDYDVASYAYANVDIAAPEGYIPNPFDASSGEVIINGETEGENLMIYINDNLSFSYEGNPVTEAGYDIDTVEFDTILYGDPDPITGDPTEASAHVILTDPDGVGFETLADFSGMWFDSAGYENELYGNIPIIVHAWTATTSEDPSTDGYDYLIECEGLDFVNINENLGFVEEITSNGFFLNDGSAGYNVNVEGGSTGLGFPMLMFKEWGFENWRYAVADNSNNITISFGLNDQAPNKMVDYVAVSSFNGENVDRMTIKPLSIDCSPESRENWPSSYSGLDYYYWSNPPADPEAEGYHYDSNADMVVSFFELTNLEDPVTGDTFEGEVTVNLSYNTTTGVWSATWDENR